MSAEWGGVRCGEHVLGKYCLNKKELYFLGDIE